MDAIRWRQIDELVDAALDMPVGEREKFVSQASANDGELRMAVLELLAAQERSGGFLQHSAMRVAAETAARNEIESPGLTNAQIANYTIESPLGAGGMGQVYLAFDKKLKRKVALKILPPEFGSDDERLKRFELEARAISSLNHPNIVTIYDVGNFEGVNYIATEFVEGRTLRDLLDGKLKLASIIQYSIQICDALAAAHAEGIVHRDIKPENIMIRTDGYVKILDFGLAKLTDPGSQTLRDFAATTKGTIIGTPAYMSPAQISDEEIDHRTDLWSCGVVLYEVLTGKNPFKGINRRETFEAIIARDPPPCSSLSPEIPDELDRIIAKTLEKDSGLGYQSAADLCADLKRVKREVDSSPSWSARSKYVSAQTRRTRWPWAAAAASLMTLLAVGVYYFLPPQPAEAESEWSAAKNIQLTFQSGTEAYPSLSPDGRSFVYTATSPEGNEDIFLQRIGGTNTTNLTSDSKAADTMPVFSPDGERIAFRSEREPKGIYVMGATGENARRVSDFGYTPSWSPDMKELVIATAHQSVPTVRSKSELWIVNIQTGVKRLLAEGPALQPAWSPDGRRIAYWFMEGGGKRIVATIPAGGGEPVVFADASNTSWNPVWSPDGRYLYYASDRNGNMAFWRAKIDLETGRPLGEHEIVSTWANFNRHLSFSRDGKRMIYVQTAMQSNIKTAAFDMEKEAILGEPVWVTRGDFEFTSPELSPDGTKFAARLIRKTQDDIVLMNVDGTGVFDLTNDAAFDRYVRWSPDGKRLAFASDRSGNYEIWSINADGTNLTQLTDVRTSSASFPIFSPEGNRMTFDTDKQGYIVDLSLPAPYSSEEMQKRPLIEDNVFFRAWDWSPDGKKLAGIESSADLSITVYSLETGSFERITDFYSIPRWLPDSRRLIFERDGKAMIAEIGTKKTRFILPEIKDTIRNIGVSRDGKLLYYTTRQSESDIWLLDLSLEK